MTQLNRLVGRRDEFALLREHLSGAGNARLAIVSGEAGIGKTWLVAEASAACEGVVLSARSLPWSSPMSLQPFTDLLRAAYETDESWVDEAVARCPAYVRGSIVNLLPELSVARDVGVPAVPDDYARPRLFAAIRAFWIAFTSVRACALVIDDAHWADPTTVDLVEYLVAQSGGQLPPLVLTYRTENPGIAAGNVERFEHLDRAPGVAKVRLFGLSRSETATLIADVTGTEPSIENANAIFARSEGHPLFAAQLATASPGHLPRALLDLFDHALAALDDHATRVAQVLAVAMRPMEQSWLCEVDGLRAQDVEEAVRQLDQHRLLRPTLDSRVDLRHALLTELVRSRMPDVRRREISGSLARAMAAGDIGVALSASPAELAVLWGDAGHREEELRWRTRAAHEARERHAWTATAAHWRRAIELLATSADAVAGLERLTGRTMAEVYSEASEAVELSGDSDAATDLALLALEHTDRDDPMSMAEALRRAGPLVGYRDPAQSRKMVDAAIELYQQLPPGAGLALAFRRRAFQHKGAGRHDDAAADIDRGLAVARQLACPEVLRRLLADRAWSDMETGSLASALQAIRSAWAVDPTGPDVGGDIFLAICHTDILLKASAPAADVLEAAVPGLRAVQELSLDEGFRVSVLRSNVAEALIADGDPGAARELLDRAHLPQVTSSNWATAVVLADTDMLAGDLATAAARLEEVSLLGLPGLTFLSDTASREAEVLMWSGHPEAAFDRLYEQLESLAQTRESRFSGRSFDLVARAARESAGRQAPAGHLGARRGSAGAGDRVGGPMRDARGDAARLRQLRDGAALDPFAGPVPADAEAHGAVWEAELSELEGAPAAELWSKAADRWRLLPRPYPRAYCLMRYAETLLITSRARVAATDALVHAHALARSHRPLLVAVERVARLGGLRLDIDTQAHRAVSDRVTAAPYDLTARELDVLRLLVCGLSNAQIGRELFISPKTASVHVTHILGKLQARTRAHAAIIAIGEGLVAAPTLERTVAATHLRQLPGNS